LLNAVSGMTLADKAGGKYNWH